MNDREKSYKIYHRNYKDIEELYDDLKDAVVDIKMEDGKIILSYKTDTVMIEAAENGGYYVYFNNEKDKCAWDDQDLYDYALEFVQERRKDIKELEIFDDRIIGADRSGLTYIDEWKRKHLIEFSACAKNYAEHNRSAVCVGERNIRNLSFVFYAPDKPIKVLFRRSFILTRKKCFLRGSKLKRFETLRKTIIEYGYSTYDLS